MIEVNVKRGSIFSSHFIFKMHKKTNCFYFKIVAKWSNNVPGGDIFSLDKVFSPCYTGDIHWTCAVIFMNEKVVQY